MKNLINSLIIFLISINIITAQTSVDQVDFQKTPSAQETIKSKYHNYLQDLNTGVVSLVKKNGKIEVLSLGKATGLAQFDEHAVFNIGSATKSFTSVLILQEVQKGNMKLGDLISKYLPKLNNVDGTLTIEQLLRHESGLGELVGANYLEISFDKNNNPTRREFLNQIPAPSENRKYNYCNTNYILLGHILESATSENYYDLLQKRIFDPCKMNESYPFLHKEITNLTHQMHDDKDVSDSLNYNMYKVYAFSAGSIASTLSDMLRFYEALYESELLLDKSHFELMTSAEESDEHVQYALGIMDVKSRGKEYYSHGGDNIGASYRNYFERDGKNYFLMFGNSVGFSFNLSLSYDFLDYINDKPIRQQKVNKSTVQKIKGDYILPKTDFNFSIIEKNQLTYIEAFNSIFPLLMENDTLYNEELDVEIVVPNIDSYQLQFQMRGDTNIAYELNHVPDSLLNKKTIDVEKYRSFLGKYTLADIGMEFELLEKDNEIIFFAQDTNMKLQEKSKNILEYAMFKIELEFDFDKTNVIQFHQNGMNLLAAKIIE